MRPKRLKIPKVKAEYNEDNEQIYCICRKDDDGRFMIQCDHCKEWFHGECIGLQDQKDAPDSYSCEKCLQLIKEFESENSVQEVANIEPPPVELPTDGSKRKLSSPSTAQPKRPKVTVSNKTDKLRRMARKGFEETFEWLFKEVLENQDKMGAPLNKDLNFDDAAGYGSMLENYLFEAYSDYGVPNDNYKSKFRSLQFNLKDPSNMRLRRRLTCVTNESIELQLLVTLPPEELGNDAVLLQAEKVARDSLKQSFKPTVIIEPENTVDDMQVDIKVEINPTSTSTTPLDMPKLSNPTAPTESLETIINKIRTPIIPTPNTDHQQSLEDLLAKIDSTPVPTAVPTAAPTPIIKEKVVKKEPLTDFVWSGAVKMPQEGSFVGSANPISGPSVPNSSWVDIVPSTLNISGRINQITASKYIYDRMEKKADICILEVIPEEKSKPGFEKLVKYFSSKQRFGVINVKNLAIKDIYLCPVEKKQPLLSVIADAKPNINIPTTYDNDRFFAIIIFSTGYLTKLNQKLGIKPKNDVTKEPRPKEPKEEKQIPNAPPAIVQIKPPPDILLQFGIIPNDIGALLKTLLNQPKK